MISQFNVAPLPPLGWLLTLLRHCSTIVLLNTTAMPPKDGLGLEAEPVANTAHVFGLIAAILMLVWSFHYRGGLNMNSSDVDQVFNVHPVLMFIGFIFLAGEAIMAYKTVNRAEKHTRKLVHLALHLIAGVIGMIGVAAVFKFHTESDIPNMYSLHSWLGLATICLFALQWLVGFLTFWYPGGTILTRTRFRPWHAYSGLTIFFMSICTAETGLVSKARLLSLTLGSEALLMKITGLCILMFGISVALCVALHDNEGRI